MATTKALELTNSQRYPGMVAVYVRSDSVKGELETMPAISVRPIEYRVEIALTMAETVSEKEAFSTLTPGIICPFSSKMTNPTGLLEEGT